MAWEALRPFLLNTNSVVSLEAAPVIVQPLGQRCLSAVIPYSLGVALIRIFGKAEMRKVLCRRLRDLKFKPVHDGITRGHMTE